MAHLEHIPEYQNKFQEINLLFPGRFDNVELNSAVLEPAIFQIPFLQLVHKNGARSEKVHPVIGKHKKGNFNMKDWRIYMNDLAGNQNNMEFFRDINGATKKDLLYIAGALAWMNGIKTLDATPVELEEEMLGGINQLTPRQFFQRATNNFLHSVRSARDYFEDVMNRIVTRTAAELSPLWSLPLFEVLCIIELFHEVHFNVELNLDEPPHLNATALAVIERVRNMFNPLLQMDAFAEDALRIFLIHMLSIFPLDADFHTGDQIMDGALHIMQETQDEIEDEEVQQFVQYWDAPATTEALLNHIGNDFHLTNEKFLNMHARNSCNHIFDRYLGIIQERDNFLPNYFALRTSTTLREHAQQTGALCEAAVYYAREAVIIIDPDEVPDDQQEVHESLEMIVDQETGATEFHAQVNQNEINPYHFDANQQLNQPGMPVVLQCRDYEMFRMLSDFKKALTRLGFFHGGDLDGANRFVQCRDRLINFVKWSFIYSQNGESGFNNDVVLIRNTQVARRIMLEGPHADLPNLPDLFFFNDQQPNTADVWLNQSA